MSFLSQIELSILSELAVLRDGWYTNSNGKKTKAKLWLHGENECTVSSCELKKAKTGSYYITVDLKRSPMRIDGVKTKVSFAPHTEFFFNENRLKEFSKACGHVLGDKPSDMAFNDYIRHVKRRCDTFIGTKLKVVISLYKEVAKDDYGQNRSANYLVHEDLIFYKMNIDNFLHVEEHIKIDYEKLAQVVLNS